MLRTGATRWRAAGGSGHNASVNVRTRQSLDGGLSCVEWWRQGCTHVHVWRRSSVPPCPVNLFERV
jgi:hypothetical protein